MNSPLVFKIKIAQGEKLVLTNFRISLFHRMVSICSPAVFLHESLFFANIALQQR